MNSLYWKLYYNLAQQSKCHAGQVLACSRLVRTGLLVFPNNCREIIMLNGLVQNYIKIIKEETFESAVQSLSIKIIHVFKYSWGVFREGTVKSHIFSSEEAML